MILLRELVPALGWLPDYGWEDARGDAQAGLTVGIMLIPQGMAYAVLAGMPPIYGLYASVVPLFVYPLFGSCRHLAVGVNAVPLILVAAGVGAVAEPFTAEYVGLALLLTGLVGATQLAMGMARLGFLANFLSRPVISGFAAAAGIIIVFSQLGNLVGMEFTSAQYVPAVVWQAVRRAGEFHPPSVLIGVGGLLALMGLRSWKPLFPAELLVLAVATVAAWALGFRSLGVDLVGDVPAGLPTLALPELDLTSAVGLWKTVVAVALVQFLSVVSLGRVFSARHPYTIDPDQELVAVGSSNLVGSVFQAIPVTGSFSRSAVNEQAGARTPLSNWVAGALVALTLLLFTPLFRYLPLPALASIIIFAAVGLVDVEEFRELFRTKPSDGWVAAFTFAATLLVGVREGVLLGVAAALVVVLYRLSRPYVAELGHLPSTRSFRNLERFAESTPVEGILILRVEAGFAFFNAEYFKEFVLEKTKPDEAGHRAVIIDGKSINFLDTTALQAMEEVVGTLQEWGVEIHFTELGGPTRDVLERSELGEELGDAHFHINPHRAVEDILRRWDEEDGTNRLEEYRRATEEAFEEVEPTSESRFT